MILLGIDTCGAVGTLALARLDQGSGGLELLGTAELAGRSTAAELAPTLGRMLAAHRLHPGALEGIVVVDGPGSFTGIRIGLSTAKALSEALAAPVFAVSRIAVLSALHAGAYVLLDAGRDELYAGCMARAGSPRAMEDQFPELPGNEWLISREVALNLHDLTARLRPGCVELEQTAVVTCEQKVAADVPGVTLVPAPTAWDALQFARQAVLQGRHGDAATLDGRYVRRLQEMYGQPATRS